MIQPIRKPGRTIGRPPSEPPRGRAGAIARNIRQKRLEVDMTVEVMARRAKIDRRFANKLEAGTAIPSVQTLGRLATALDCELADLLAM